MRNIYPNDNYDSLYRNLKCPILKYFGPIR